MEEKITKVPPRDAAYLREHHKVESCMVMAKKLGRALTTIYGYMNALDLPRLPRAVRAPGVNHPFKGRNVALKNVILSGRITNSLRNNPLRP